MGVRWLLLTLTLTLTLTLNLTLTLTLALTRCARIMSSSTTRGCGEPTTTRWGTSP